MSGCSLNREEQPRTLGALGQLGINSLCGALRAEDLAPAALDVLETLGQGWRSRSVHERPWPSDITDDGTPFEFSVAFEQARPELRMLAEAQGQAPSTAEQWSAGLALSEQLQVKYAADLSSLQRIQNLFRPEPNSRASFGLWHGVTIRSGGLPEFKVYLNPQMHGWDNARNVVREALFKLGMEHADRFIAEVTKQCEGRVRPVYFSLDLLQGPTRRVKIYLAHDEPGCADAQKALARCRNLHATDVADWCNVVVGEQTRFEKRPLLSCFAFSEARPHPTGTLHIPARCYVESDQVLLERVVAVLDSATAATYRRAVASMAKRPLASGTGLQTYVSLRRVQGHPRVTVYLSPEAYSWPPPAQLAS